MWVSRQYCVKHYYAKWIINHLFQLMSTTCQMQIPKVPDAEKQKNHSQLKMYLFTQLFTKLHIFTEPLNFECQLN